MQKIILFIVLFIGNFTYAENSDVKNRCYNINDPHVDFNRAIHRFNLTIYRTIIYPPVKLYNAVTPEWLKMRTNSIFDTLKLPSTLINNIAQKDRNSASDTIGRLLVNLTLGLGGLFDVASKFDIPNKPQTFDDTLAYYDMPYGSYSISPILGPSTTRGSLGKLLDLLTNPIDWIIGLNSNLYWVAGYEIASGTNILMRYNDFIFDYTTSSVDPYSKIRSTYIQYLAVKNPNCEEIQEINYTLDE